jgi:DNA-directed RNA polymerase specialized sigma24 family protein
VRQGDRDEFERVFRSAYRSVLGSTYLVLHDRGRAEEVTQDAFVRLYERWGRRSASTIPWRGCAPSP